MATTLTIRDNGYDRALSAFRQAGGSVRVGFMGGETHDGGADLATIATVHEFGVEMTVTERQSAWMRANLGTAHAPGDTLVIPERSVVRPAFDAQGPGLADEAAKRIADTAEKGPGVVAKELGRLGAKAQTAMRAAYVSARDTVAPLSDVTLEQRAMRSSGSTAPLVDTGQLVQSVQYEANVTYEVKR